MVPRCGVTEQEEAMSLQLTQADAPQIGIRALTESPVIIATDGFDGSDPALIAGRVIAGDHCGAFRVVTVVRPMVPVAPEAGIACSVEVDRERHADQECNVREQMWRVWGDDIGVDLDVFDGDAATQVAEFAHRTDASLIVTGLGRHRVMDRLLGDETALRLIRLADVPVLSVAKDLASAPRRIVVAIDFTETSERAAGIALELAAPGAIIHLAHVAPREAFPHGSVGTSTSYQIDAGEALRKLRDRLHVPREIDVQGVLLHGDPATELLAFASSVRADLIASGSHGRGFIARLLIGSVTTRLLRCATCSTLTVPLRAAVTM
jgi:nucleotide-binding universal stress UspA family protein